MIVHRGRLLEPSDAATHAHRADVLELCRRHDVDPNDTKMVQILRPRFLRFTIYRNNEHGKRYVDPDMGGAATKVIDVLRVGKLPAWWKPDADAR